ASKSLRFHSGLFLDSRPHDSRFATSRFAPLPLPSSVRIDILTTIPELFATEPPGVLGVSIPARAAKAGAVSFHATNIRDFADNKHDKTDDRPFGGGPGMVMMCQPVWDAAQAVESADPAP